MSTAPHPGLKAAVVLAGGPRALGRIIGKHHNYITYRMNHGKGLPSDLAVVVGQKLGIKASILLDKKEGGE